MFVKKRSAIVLAGCFIQNVAGCEMEDEQGAPAPVAQETEQPWSSMVGWPLARDIHEEMSARAYDRAKTLAGGSDFLDRDAFLEGADVADDISSYASYPQHFQRSAKVSSADACKNALNGIYDTIYKALSFSDKKQFSRWVGFAAHTVQDSTCSEHAECAASSTPSNIKISRICVGANEPLTFDSCQHSDWDEVMIQSVDPGPLFEVGVKATTGLLYDVYRLQSCGFTNKESIRWLLSMDFSIADGSNNGYLNCDGLPTNDAASPPKKPNCGTAYCAWPTPTCCEPGICAKNAAWCPLVIECGFGATPLGSR